MYMQALGHNLQVISLDFALAHFFISTFDLAVTVLQSRRGSLNEPRDIEEFSAGQRQS